MIHDLVSVPSSKLRGTPRSTKWKVCIEGGWSKKVLSKTKGLFSDNSFLGSESKCLICRLLHLWGVENTQVSDSLAQIKRRLKWQLDYVLSTGLEIWSKWHHGGGFFFFFFPFLNRARFVPQNFLQRLFKSHGILPEAFVETTG